MLQTIPLSNPKIGEILAREGFLSKEQLARGLEAQKKECPTMPLGKVCVALGFVSTQQLGTVLMKHHKRIPLGELLAHLGLINAAQLQDALEHQRKQNPRKKLGAVMMEKGLIDEATLIRALYEQSQSDGNGAKQPRGKFDALVIAGRLQQAEVDAAQKDAQRMAVPVENILMERYRVGRKEIGVALSVYYRCPFMEFDEKQTVAREQLRGVNLSYLKANFWVPLRVTDKSVVVLLDDPYAHTKVQDIQRLFPGKEIERRVGLRDDILRYINSINGPAESKARVESLSAILGQLEEADWDEQKEVKEEVLVNENDSGVVRLVNQIISEASKQGVSDIHIEPQGGQLETLIRFRVDGRCFEYLRVPSAYRRALVSRLKIMAGIDIAERRKPQDGKIKFRLRDRSIELRVATIPTAGLGNEDVVLRLLTAEKPLPLDELHMIARNLREFRTILAKPYGLILCVGPTGSGKTTTLHSALSAINETHRKIWTAEDPVELTQPGLRQVQVNSKIGFTFATAMRAFLRADPDVIMVGEIRDRETADVAIEASLTGHLVLSTLHTNSSVETVTRLPEMGVDPFNFADSLLGVLAQRLARCICESCREKYHPTRDEYDALIYGYGEEAFAKLEIAYDESFFLYRGKGCPACRDSGYRGRIGLHELLINTERVKQWIHSRATVAELHKLALAEGMTTLVQDGVLKVLQGWTDYNQVKAVAMR